MDNLVSLPAPNRIPSILYYLHVDTRPLPIMWISFIHFFSLTPSLTTDNQDFLSKIPETG